MIMMTNGVEERFVFDSAINYYKSIGFVPVTEEPTPAIVVSDAPDEPEEAVTEPEVIEEPAEEPPVTEEPAPADYEPNENGRYECPYCDKDYSTKANLLKHISQAHPEVQ